MALDRLKRDVLRLIRGVFYLPGLNLQSGWLPPWWRAGQKRPSRLLVRRFVPIRVRNRRTLPKP